MLLQIFFYMFLMHMIFVFPLMFLFLHIITDVCFCLFILSHVLVVYCWFSFWLDCALNEGNFTSVLFIAVSLSMKHSVSNNKQQ